MTKLKNHELQKESMQSLLLGLGISNDEAEVTVSSDDGLYSFLFQDDQQAKDLVELMLDNNPGAKVASFTIADIITEEVLAATSVDGMQDLHRSTCLSFMKAVVGQLSSKDLSIDGSKLVLNLPNQSYVDVIGNLQYPNIKFNAENKLLIDVKSYVFKDAKSIAVLEKFNANVASIVLLGSEVIDNKNICFKTKQLPDNNLEVTPFFFAPTTCNDSPTYSFMLDMSGSLSPDLPKLKESVKELAKQLFELQPNASLVLSTFDDEIKEIGEYSQSQLGMLQTEVDRLQTGGQTALLDAALASLEFFTKNNAKNRHVLLFTDGKENSSCIPAQKLQNYLDEKFPESHSSLVFNKFCLINFNTTTNQQLKNIVDRFNANGHIIDTSNPNFVIASENENSQKLIEWSAIRDLFKVTLSVVSKDQSPEKNESVVSIPLDLSGQVVQLEPQVISPAQKLLITVVDGDGNIVSKGERSNVISVRGSYSATFFYNSSENSTSSSLDSQNSSGNHTSSSDYNEQEDYYGFSVWGCNIQ